MAVVAEPPLVAEVSTQDEMAGVALPQTFVNATAAVTADMSMEAATEVAAYLQLRQKTTKLAREK